MTYTHQIVSMTFGQTKGSNSPMWRCTTLDGQRVNVFKHADPNKDNAHLFEHAGYMNCMGGLEVDQTVFWKTSPISVVMRKTDDGKWWEVVAVAPRPAGAAPDPDNTPDLALFKQAAQEWAQEIERFNYKVVFWDVETTGTTPDDEIVQFAAVSTEGKTLISTYIRPLHPERMMITGAESVHHIDPDAIASAPTFKDIYPELRQILTGRLWVVYNKSFDPVMLENDCLRNGLIPIPAIGINCAMEQFARWHGEWNHKFNGFTSKPLTFAAEQLNISVLDTAHDALVDALTTRYVVSQMRYAEPQIREVIRDGHHG